jgi:hypothetical protein
MTGLLPPLPDHIAKRDQPTTEEQPMTTLPLPSQILARLRWRAESGDHEAKALLHLIDRADKGDQDVAVFVDSYSRTIAALCRRLEALECGATDLPAPAAPVDASSVANALLVAEAALTDVAEGLPDLPVEGSEPIEWAETRCAKKALAAIRPVMRQHGIRTSEFPPAARWGHPHAAAPAPGENLATPPAPRPEGDWFAVAMIAQDMRSRGLAEQVAGEELLKLANGKRSQPGTPATPPAPEAPGEALAARPLLEKVARLDNSAGITVAEVRQLAGQAAAWLRSNPPGRPVAIEPRGCPTPGACSCVEPTPPAPVPGDVAELVAWIHEEAIHGPDADEWRRAATLLQHLASPAYLVVARPPEGFSDLLKSEPGRIQVCTAGVSIEPLGVAPGPTFQDAIKLVKGCHDYSGGHSGAEGEAWHGAIDTVVGVLKKATDGPWDSQIRAVYGVGAESQAGEGEA